jgi:hypothetical protein
MRRTKTHQYPIFTERSKNSQPPSLLLVEGFTRHTVQQTGLNLIKDFFLEKKHQISYLHLLYKREPSQSNPMVEVLDFLMACESYLRKRRILE